MVVKRLGSASRKLRARQQRINSAVKGLADINAFSLKRLAGLPGGLRNRAVLRMINTPHGDKVLDRLLTADRSPAGVKRALDIARFILRSGDNYGANVAYTLGELRERRAVPELERALKSSNWAIRQQAARALGSIGDPHSVNSLRSVLNDKDSSVINCAAHSLAAILGYAAIPDIRDGIRYVRDHHARHTMEVLIMFLEADAKK